MPSKKVITIAIFLVGLIGELSAIPLQNTNYVESAKIQTAPRQDVDTAVEGVAAGEGAAQTLEGVATLLTSIFKGISDIPVSAINAAYKPFVTQKPAVQQNAHALGGTPQIVAGAVQPVQVQGHPEIRIAVAPTQPQYVAPPSPPPVAPVTSAPTAAPAPAAPTTTASDDDEASEAASEAASETATDAASETVTEAGEDVDEDADVESET